jgi:hypothetical protein
MLRWQWGTQLQRSPYTRIEGNKVKSKATMIGEVKPMPDNETAQPQHSQLSSHSEPQRQSSGLV